jgi:hypothetical protein
LDKPFADVEATLVEVARALRSANDPWWIIGSAAVLLSGGNPGDVADVDVIVSASDLEVLYAPLGLSDTPDTSKAIFRSQRFGRWRAPPLDVEFMAGLELRVDDHWHRIAPITRRAVRIGDCDVFVPERHELVALLTKFGRPKDLVRAATLAGD